MNKDEGMREGGGRRGRGRGGGRRGRGRGEKEARKRDRTNERNEPGEAKIIRI